MSKSTLGIGIIGYGYWGPNLVRNIAEIPDARIVSVSDLQESRLKLVQQRYPGIKTTNNCDELINDPTVDAVAIATPVSSHFELGMKALKAGKHVLVEKPMTFTVEEGRKLVEEAQKRQLVLMVDHTFVYTGAVRKVRELVKSKALGDIYYYDSTRINLGLFQHDVNVIWDLAVHDLSIMDYVLELEPVAVAATGANHVDGRPENIAFITLFFNNNLIAHMNVNWLSPVKLRHILIGGTQKMVVYNDLEPSEKIKVYDAGIKIDNHPDKIYETLIGYRTGDMWAPKCDSTEALKVELTHFVRCIQNKEKPLTGGEMGLRVVKVLEAASTSLRERGRPIELKI